MREKLANLRLENQKKRNKIKALKLANLKMENPKKRNKIKALKLANLRLENKEKRNKTKVLKLKQGNINLDNFIKNTIKKYNEPKPKKKKITDLIKFPKANFI